MQQNKSIRHPIHSCSLSQPEELKGKGRFLMKLKADRDYELEFRVDGFLALLVQRMNEGRERFDRNRPAYSEDEVRPIFERYFLHHQKVDINNPVFQATSSSLMNIVLSGLPLLINDEDLVTHRKKDEFKAKAPLAEDIEKD